MKKIAVLIVSSLLLITFSATAQRVIVRSNGNYEVSIDGRYYNTNTNNATISNLRQGSHSVQVYQVSRGGLFGLGKRRTLVSSSGFNLMYNDVMIDVDAYGQLRVNQYGNNVGNGNYQNNNSYNKGNRRMKKNQRRDYRYQQQQNY